MLQSQSQGLDRFKVRPLWFTRTESLVCSTNNSGGTGSVRHLHPCGSAVMNGWLSGYILSLHKTPEVVNVEEYLHKTKTNLSIWNQESQIIAWQNAVNLISVRSELRFSLCTLEVLTVSVTDEIAFSQCVCWIGLFDRCSVLQMGALYVSVWALRSKPPSAPQSDGWVCDKVVTREAFRTCTQGRVKKK